MTSFFSRNHLLSALLFSLVVLGQTRTPATSVVVRDDEKLVFNHHVKVELFNKLPNNAELNVHCKSGNDDLGTQVVGAGRSYAFDFKVNLWGTTLFFCGAWWQGGCVSFDIYNFDKDEDRCSHYCRWEATDQYVKGYNDTQAADINVPWKNKC